MSANHTPGPWQATNNSWEVSSVFSAAGEVARCYIDSDVTEDSQDKWEPVKEANARLIAAAPELLEALEWMLHVYGADVEAGESDVIDKARAAIEKVEKGAA